MVYLLGGVAAGLVLLAIVLFSRIGQLEERVARLEGQRDVGPYRAAPPEPPVVHVPSGSEEADAVIADALQQGNLIQAIKRYREITGAGLRDAKAAVEAMRDRRG